jgi:UDP-3-O-[3-hydroxymyristoyl] N-acetylglucosamine deacetylase/3-hydroxyacyl-[acyl-carrier-protein] dehydratase
MSNKQRTIKKSVSIEGTGLHTGEKCTMTFHPAKADEGIQFLRSDLESKPKIPASAEWVNKTDRGTSLQYGDVSIHTTEHVLAAVIGLEIDNILIELTAPEPPIRDGSSLDFINLLSEAETEEQDEERKYLVIDQEIEFKHEKSGAVMKIEPHDGYAIDCLIDYGTNVLDKQTAKMEKISDFAENFSQARTFCFLHELELLVQHNLIKGGDLNNAIVFVERTLEEEEMNRLGEYFGKEKVEVRPEGVLNNLELRYENEAARHKLLDIVGDLALVGKPIKGKITAYKPGHGPNTAFAKELQKLIKDRKNVKI